MKKLFASSTGLGKSDQLLLAAYLDLVALTDGHVFGLRDDPGAAIHFIKVSTPDGAAALAERVPGLAYVLVDSLESSKADGVWNLASPIRFEPLRELLIDIVSKRALWALQGLTLSAPPKDSLLNITVFSGHRKLEQILNAVDRALEAGTPQEFFGVDGLDIVFFPKRKLFSFRSQGPLHSWLEYFAKSSKAISIRPCPLHMVDQQAVTVTLARFRWELTRRLSRGILLPGIALMTEFNMSRWPNFDELGGNSPQDLRACALLFSRVASIEAAVQASGISRVEAIGLLNACALEGCLRGVETGNLLQRTVRTSSHEQVASNPQVGLASASFGGLFGKIRSVWGVQKRV
jgi:hypothetical protein